MYQFLATNAPETPQLAQLEEIRERMKDRPNLATTQVRVDDFLDARDQALRAHASQVSPDSAFFFWPNDLQREAWPFEDFQLALTLVESPLPETDLFAGIIAEEVSA